MIVNHDLPQPPVRNRRRAQLIAAGATLLALVGIGVGLRGLVRWLEPPPLETPPPELRGEPGLQRFTPLTDRRLLSRTRPLDDDEEPPAVPPEHPFAKTRITGRVYDLVTGEGLSGAVVRVKPTFGEPRLGPPKGDGSAAYTTRSDGSYALKGVPPGTFDLVVNAEGYVPARSGFKKFSALEDDDGFDVGLVRGRVLEGRVVTPDRRPIAGARVSVSTSDAISLHDEEPVIVTGADGHFVIEPVETSELRIVAAHPLHGTQLAIVAAADEHTSDVELVLGGGRRLRGHVRGSAGPIAGARVMVGLQRIDERIVATTPSASGLSVATGPDGAFELGVSEAGPLVVLAQAAGYELGSALIAELAGEATPSVEITLELAAEFAGVVLAADGRPALKAQVTIIPMASRIRRLPLEAWTGEDGRFQIDGVPRTGPYKVAILHHAHPALMTIEETISTSHRYQLEAQGRILGTIVDATTGGPVTRYQYIVSGPAHRQASAVSVSGSFEVDQLPAGTYGLSIDAEGYEAGQVESIVVSAGERVDNVVVRLRPAGTIVGRVLGAHSGTVIIHAWGRESQLEAEAIAGEDGRFSIGDLPGGRYTLTAFAEDDEGEVRGEVSDVSVESGGVTQGVEIALAPIIRDPG